MTRRELIGLGLALGAQSRTTTARALVELRTYATVPHRRDALIDLFERELLDAYEAGGTQVLGTFRDLDVPDRWVWMRAFVSAEQRGQALQHFYSSERWQQYRDAANATIADTSNALLLRVVGGDLQQAHARPTASDAAPLIECQTYTLEDGAEAHFAAKFTRLAVPLLGELGAAPLAMLLPDRSQNFYPRQPIRTESVFVTFTRFDTCAAYETHTQRRNHSRGWRDLSAHAFEPLLHGPIETLLLAPTARSRIR
jgi:quinol monooxygenase YgiN